MNYNLFGNDNILNGVHDVVAKINSDSESVSKEIDAIIKKLIEIKETKDAARIIELEIVLKILYKTSLPTSKKKFKELISAFQKKGDDIYSRMQRIQSQYEMEMKREEKMNRDNLKDKLAALKKEGKLLKATYLQDVRADDADDVKETSFANKVGNKHKSCTIYSQVSQERTTISQSHQYKMRYKIQAIGRDGVAQEQDKERQILMLSFVTEIEEISCTTRLPYLDQTSIRFEDENLHKWYVIRFTNTSVKGVAKLICTKR